MISLVNLNILHFFQYFLFFLFLYSMIYMFSLVLPGTSRSAYGLQKISKNKNCDIRDWHLFKWRLPCHSWDGRIWGSIFWNRWWRRAGGEPLAVVGLGQNPLYFWRLQWKEKDWTLLSWGCLDLSANFDSILIIILDLLYSMTYSWNSPIQILCYLSFLYLDFYFNLFFADSDMIHVHEFRDLYYIERIYNFT